MNVNNIITLLLNKTREGKVQWQDASDNSFFCVIESMTITVERVSGTFPIFRTTIRNNDGRVIETEDANSLVNPSPEMTELFELARRQALKIDESLQNLSGALKNL